MHNDREELKSIIKLLIIVILGGVAVLCVLIFFAYLFWEQGTPGECDVPTREESTIIAGIYAFISCLLFGIVYRLTKD